MEKIENVSGKCACGSIEISAKSMSTDLGACHCGTCRKITAGPFLAVDCGSEVVITGKENLSIYNSSEWAERGFCKICGTALFYRLKGNNQHIVNSEIFECNELVFGHQIFIDQKPNYFEFKNITKNLTAKEVFAAASK